MPIIAANVQVASELLEAHILHYFAQRGLSDIEKMCKKHFHGDASHKARRLRYNLEELVAPAMLRLSCRSSGSDSAPEDGDVDTDRAEKKRRHHKERKEGYAALAPTHDSTSHAKKKEHHHGTEEDAAATTKHKASKRERSPEHHTAAPLAAHHTTEEKAGGKKKKASAAAPPVVAAPVVAAPQTSPKKASRKTKSSAPSTPAVAPAVPKSSSGLVPMVALKSLSESQPISRAVTYVKNGAPDSGADSEEDEIPLAQRKKQYVAPQTIPAAKAQTASGKSAPLRKGLSQPNDSDTD